MNDSKRYLKKIRAILPVWGSYEKRFYKDIRSLCHAVASNSVMSKTESRCMYCFIGNSSDHLG